MDGYTLEHAMRQDPHATSNFAGVFASDTLPHRLHHKPCLLIVNTDPIFKPGTHWLAIHIDREGRGTFFDSYGFPPYIPNIKRFLNRMCTSWKYNHIDLQNLGSTVCGQYCVMFLLYQAHGFSLDRFCKLFTTNLRRNDILVNKMFRHSMKRAKPCQEIKDKPCQTCTKRRK